MQTSMEEILLYDLVQTDPDKRLRFTPQRALSVLKLQADLRGDPQDFGYDAEKWKEWLLAHSDGFKKWMDYQESLRKGSNKE